MKLAKHGGSATVVGKGVGEAHVYKVVESAKMYQVLSDLYRDKVEAPLREYLANAIDSARRAGTHETKGVDIHVPSLNAPYVAIRDYGVGLTDAQVVNLFTAYFGSDKDTSNDAIGAFGLGSKSFRAYTDNASLTCWDGVTRRVYNLYLDKGVPKLQKVSEKGDTADTGVEIKYAVRTNDFVDFSNKLQKLSVYMRDYSKLNIQDPSGYSDHEWENRGLCGFCGTGTTSSITKQRFASGDILLVRDRAGGGGNYYHRSSSTPVYVEMGGVMYPAQNLPGISEQLQGNEVLVLRAAIGMFSVTPSRDDLETTTANTDALLECYTNLQKDVTTSIQALLSKATVWDVYQNVFRKIHVGYGVLRLKGGNSRSTQSRGVGILANGYLVAANKWLAKWNKDNDNAHQVTENLGFWIPKDLAPAVFHKRGSSWSATGVPTLVDAESSWNTPSREIKLLPNSLGGFSAASSIRIFVLMSEKAKYTVKLGTLLPELYAELLTSPEYVGLAASPEACISKSSFTFIQTKDIDTVSSTLVDDYGIDPKMVIDLSKVTLAAAKKSKKTDTVSLDKVRVLKPRKDIRSKLAVSDFWEKLDTTSSDPKTPLVYVYSNNYKWKLTEDGVANHVGSLWEINRYLETHVSKFLPQNYSVVAVKSGHIPVLEGLGYELTSLESILRGNRQSLLNNLYQCAISWHIEYSVPGPPRSSETAYTHTLADMCVALYRASRTRTAALLQKKEFPNLWSAVSQASAFSNKIYARATNWPDVVALAHALLKDELSTTALPFWEGRFSNYGRRQIPEGTLNSAVHDLAGVAWKKYTKIDRLYDDFPLFMGVFIANQTAGEVMSTYRSWALSQVLDSDTDRWQPVQEVPRKQKFEEHRLYKLLQKVDTELESSDLPECFGDPKLDYSVVKV